MGSRLISTTVVRTRSTSVWIATIPARIGHAAASDRVVRVSAATAVSTTAGSRSLTRPVNTTSAPVADRC